MPRRRRSYCLEAMHISPPMSCSVMLTGSLTGLFNITHNTQTNRQANRWCAQSSIFGSINATIKRARHMHVLHPPAIPSLPADRVTLPWYQSSSSVAPRAQIKTPPVAQRKKEEEQRQKTQPSPVYIVSVTPLTKMETKKCLNILRRRGWESHARPAWTPRTQGEQKKERKK
jgi:hypothetical protein